MSKVDLVGVVENINIRTNIYTPVIEAIVNSIQSIEDSKRDDGEITITLKRSEQESLKFEDDALPDITSVEIKDNGVGFNQENTNSFDTLYSRYKATQGGKGFGRFMFLKYFEDIRIESIYKSGVTFSRKTFDFGKNNLMVANIKNTDNVDHSDTYTTLYLNSIKHGRLDKRATTIARKLLEKLLIYFIRDNYKCPRIIIKVEGEKDIILNELLDGEYAEIQEIGKLEFDLTKGDASEQFKLRVFKIFYPDNQKSRISLTAHNREVTENPIHLYVPEFEDNFYEESEDGTQKDYMIKAYVVGDYLDKNVSLERNTFNIPKTSGDAFYAFSQLEIEKEAARQTRDLEIFNQEIKSREEKKRQKINDYINTEAPWHKAYFEDLDLSAIPYHINEEDIDLELHRTKFQQEKIVKEQIKEIMSTPDGDLSTKVEDVVNQISKANMSELVHYIALRKNILNLLKRSLEIKDDNSYSAESTVHSIIFPLRSDSFLTPYDNHNLWIVDEKLNFTEYISSDQPLNGGTSERPDILIFNRKMVFRGENEVSNPITIFEFKKPQRDDFVNQSSKEDPVQQIIRYVNDIKDGKFKTINGRDIIVGENTPFYGFVVCDLTKKVTDWLLKEKDFKAMPDGQGWFQWVSNINLYIEVLSWDKLLKDAEMRNKVFFRKLGIE